MRKFNGILLTQLKTNPIGVSKYDLYKEIPKELKGKLPTTKMLSDLIRDNVQELMKNNFNLCNLQ